MVRFRSRPDGTPYPIEDGKGRGGIAAAAGATALMVAAYSGAFTAGEVGSLTSESISIRTNNAKQAVRKGQHGKVWQRMRLRVTRQRRPQHYIDCVLHSFGQAREFFIRKPCRSLTRTVVPLEDEAGNRAVVSIAWVRMPTARTAHELNRLDYRDGTGDIYAFGNSVLAAQGVSFTGEHYEPDVRKNVFIRAEAATLSGNPDPALLDGIAEVASLLPPPR